MSIESLFYDDVSIGQLPLGWGKIKVDSALVDSLGGFSCARTKTVASGITHLRPMNISSNGEVVITSDTQYITPDFRDDLPAFHLQPGDVLYNNTNSVELVGKSAIVRSPMQVAFSNHINRLRVKDSGKLDPRWLALALRRLQNEGFFATHSNKWIGQAGFSISELARVDIPVPYADDPARSLAEQRRIVARIEALFAELRECRALQQAIVDDTDRLMEAVLAEVFAAENVKTWEYVDSLDQLVEINAPLVDPTDSKYHNLPHINGEVIEEGTGRLLAYRTASEDRMRSAKYLFNPGSVLYSKIRPYLRKVAIVNFRGLCSADVYPLELKNARLTREFLRWLLLSPHFTNYANSVSGRARMPKINRSQLFGYQMRYPSWPEQMRITGLLEAVQAQIGEMKAVEHSDSNLLIEMEQSILAQAFRGEL